MSFQALDSSSHKMVDILAYSQGLAVYQQSLLAGENQQLGRLMGGAITPYGSLVNTTVSTTAKSGTGVFYGLFVLSSGSGTGSISVWDGLSSGGTTLWSSIAISSAGSFMPALGAASAGLGLIVNTGLTVQQSSGGSFYPIVV